MILKKNNLKKNKNKNKNTTTSHAVFKPVKLLQEMDLFYDLAEFVLFYVKPYSGCGSHWLNS